MIPKNWTGRFKVYAWDPDGSYGSMCGPGKWRWAWSGNSPLVAIYHFLRARRVTGRASLDWTS